MQLELNMRVLRGFAELCQSSSLYKPDVDSHALTCTHGRPVFKTKNREAPITTHTEAVWLQPQFRTPLLHYIFTWHRVVCCYVNVLNVVFITFKSVVYDSNPIHFLSNSENFSSWSASFLLKISGVIHSPGSVKPDLYFCVEPTQSLRHSLRTWPMPLSAFILVHWCVCVALQ